MQRFRRRVVAGCAAALALATAGCWPQMGQGPDRTGHNPFETAITIDTIDTLAPAWTRPVPGTPWALVTSPSSVVVAAGSSLSSLDSGTGAIRWSAPAGSQLSWVNPIVDGGVVTASQGVLTATTSRFDEQTGALLGNQIDTAIARRGDRTLFQRTVQSAPGQFAQYFSVMNDDRSYVWSGPVTSYGAVSDGASRLSLGSERVFVSSRGLLPDNVSYGNGLRAYDRQLPSFCGPGRPPASCPVWAIGLPGRSSTAPVVGPGEDTLYVGTSDGTVAAVDAAIGAVLWTANVGSAVFDEPALADGTLFVAPDAGGLLAFDAHGCGAPTCAPAWQLDTGGQTAGQPAVAGGLVFVAAIDGTLMAVPANGCTGLVCTPAWTHELGGFVTAAPIVSNGQLLVGVFSTVVSLRPTAP
jgi:outer membrane protein assembly factor BamB